MSKTPVEVKAVCLLLNDRLHIQIVGKSFNNSLGQKLKSIKNTKRFTIIKKHFLCLILGFAIYKWERRNGNFVHKSTDNMRNSLLDNPALNVRKYTSNALFINSWIYKCKSVSSVKRKKNVNYNYTVFGIEPRTTMSAPSSPKRSYN